MGLYAGVNLDVLGKSTLRGIHIAADVADVLELLLVANQNLVASLGLDAGVLAR